MSRRLLPALCLLPACLVPDAMVERFLDRDNDGQRTAEIGGPDCDDDDPNVNTTQVERCGNGVDDNCDGSTDDDGLDGLPWYFDGDGDGFGDPTVVRFACAQPEHYVLNADDCDDSNTHVSPAATEVCGDGVDNNCGPELEDELLRVWHLDRDDDGVGGDTTWVGCEAPPGYAAQGGDCDDLHPHVAPGLPERCDGLDNDCDGIAEPAPHTCYADLDHDGFGDPAAPVATCESTCPADSAPVAGDCDDLEAARHPGAVEACNGLDDDCDTLPEPPPLACYADADGDGHGDPSRPVDFCAPACPEGFTDAPDDCDDEAADRAPGNPEVCDDRDNDCDPGTVDAIVLRCWADADGDGFGDPNEPRPRCVNYCDGTDVPNDGDCDDTYDRTFEGATERCDGRDNDCNTATVPDEGANCSATLGPIWMPNHNAVYFLRSESFNHEDSKEICNNRGYHHWRIDSDAELSDVMDEFLWDGSPLWTDLQWNICGPGTGWQHPSPDGVAPCVPVTPWMGSALRAEPGARAVILDQRLLRSNQSTLDQHPVICEANP